MNCISIQFLSSLSISGSIGSRVSEYPESLYQLLQSEMAIPPQPRSRNKLRPFQSKYTLSMRKKKTKKIQIGFVFLSKWQMRTALSNSQIIFISFLQVSISIKINRLTTIYFPCFLGESSSNVFRQIPMLQPIPYVHACMQKGTREQHTLLFIRSGTQIFQSQLEVDRQKLPRVVISTNNFAEIRVNPIQTPTVERITPRAIEMFREASYNRTVISLWQGWIWFVSQQPSAKDIPRARLPAIPLTKGKGRNIEMRAKTETEQQSDRKRDVLAGRATNPRKKGGRKVSGEVTEDWYWQQAVRPTVLRQTKAILI